MDTRSILDSLDKTIESRKNGDSSQSYVADLFSKGPNQILRKVIEEAGEVVLASKDGNKKEIIKETADLWFHSIVLLVSYGIKTEEVLDELQRREGVSGISEKRNRINP